MSRPSRWNNPLMNLQQFPDNASRIVGLLQQNFIFERLANFSQARYDVEASTIPPSHAMALVA